MRISPEEVRQQQFALKFRGFNIEEVDNYLELVAHELDELIRENTHLKEDLNTSRKELAILKKNEMNFRTMIGAAQEFKEDVTSRANKEAELLFKQAELKAKEILKNAEERRYSLEKRIEELIGTKIQLEISLRSVLESHLRMLDSQPKTPSILTKPLEQVENKVNGS